MARRTPATARTITGISEGFRAANVVFMRNGELDPEERYVLGLLTEAAGYAAWSDWGRRAANSYADAGEINGQLLRERRELVALFGDDTDAA